MSLAANGSITAAGLDLQVIVYPRYPVRINAIMHVRIYACVRRKFVRVVEEATRAGVIDLANGDLIERRLGVRSALHVPHRGLQVTSSRASLIAFLSQQPVQGLLVRRSSPCGAYSHGHRRSAKEGVLSLLTQSADSSFVSFTSLKR